MTVALPAPGRLRTAVRPSLRGAAPLLLAAALAALVVTPVGVVLASVFTPTPEVWAHLWRTRLPGMLLTTAALVVAVGTGSLVLGTGLAWLVTAYAFPLRRLVGWVLVLPLAAPGYVLGFVWLDTLDYAGPVQTAWRGWLGDDAPFPDVRTWWVCAAVLTLSLYPYVYLLARAAFREQAAATLDVARTLGCSRRQAFRRVALPMARPSLAAGVALVAMEVLTDIGTVRLFNVQTVADGVFRVWYGLADRGAATELASLLVFAAVGVVVLERRARGGARFTQQGGRGRTVAPVRLGPLGAAGALVACAAVLALAFVVPVLRLVGWAAEARRTGRTATMAGDFAFHAGNTLRLAVLATVACVVVGVALSLAVRRSGRRATAAFARLATVGYAVPGPVVAVGVIVTLAALDRWEVMPGGVLLAGSLTGLVYALAVRFLAVGYQSVESSLGKVHPAVTASARTLGAGPWRVATRVELPLARAGLVVAAALVAIDVMKELPATLLLRPFGFDTLSVWVWQMTSESLWVEASVPALAIVATGVLPVVALLVALERGAEVTL